MPTVVAIRRTLQASSSSLVMSTAAAEPRWATGAVLAVAAAAVVAGATSAVVAGVAATLVVD